MSAQSGPFDAASLVITNTTTTYNASVTYAGTGYTTGDRFIFRGTLFGGTSPANDLTVVVTAGTVGGLPNAVSAVALSGVATGTVASVVLVLQNNDRTARDPSEVTRRLRERLIYNESRSGTNIVGSLKDTRLSRLGIIKLNDYGGANQLELRQGNEFRMAYLKGRLNCGACIGGGFNANGPLSSS
jgi:hypothetical protein